MDNINGQKIANNKQNDKLNIKFQIQRTMKKPKCMSKPGTIYKLFSPERFTIQPLEHKYFHFGVTTKQRGDKMKLQSLEIKKKKGRDNMMGGGGKEWG